MEQGRIVADFKNFIAAEIVRGAPIVSEDIRCPWTFGFVKRQNKHAFLDG